MALNLNSTFHEFKLNGANINRYFIVYVDSKAIVAAFRKQALDEKIRAGKKQTNYLYGIGQVPLLLIDGNPSPETVQNAMATFGVSWWVALCRNIDIKLKKDLKLLHKRMISGGYIYKSDKPYEWVAHYASRYEAEENEEIKAEIYPLIEDYLQYEAAKQAWHDNSLLPVHDVATGGQVGDINEYIYRLAQERYPVGIENITQKNVKLNTIIKHKWFLSDTPPPNAKNAAGQPQQLDLFNWGKSHVSVEDTISRLAEFIKPKLGDGVHVVDMMKYLAEIGIYESDIALYVMGRALAQTTCGHTVMFDGVADFRHQAQPDISGEIVDLYKKRFMTRRSDKVFFNDKTNLKEKISCLFNIVKQEESRPEFDTLGFALLKAKMWVIDNLKYPIAFLDGMIHEMFMSDRLYGEELKRVRFIFQP